MADLLQLDVVRAGYGAAVVLDGVSLAIGEGECVTLLGRNGVGKTTLLTTVMGLTRHHGGRMTWRGAELTRLATHVRARSGLGWVPQERRMWRSLTVAEHLTAVATRGAWTVSRALELFPALGERVRNRGHQLSGGEQQMLAIVRALVTNPSLLLPDEPMEGLAPLIVQQLADVLRRLAAEGLGMLLVEQRPQLALSIASRALLMHRGRVVHESSSAALAGDRDTLNRWLAPA